MLSEAEREVRINRVNDVFIIRENALGGFWAEVGFRGLVCDGTDVGCKHHIKLFNVVPVFFSTSWTFDVFSAELLGSNFFGDVGDFVGAEALVTFFTFDEWVGESCGVAGSDPGFWIHNNGGIDAVHIVALLDEIVPPFVHNFLFQRDAKWAVVPSTGHAAVDVGAWENESAAFT